MLPQNQVLERLILFLIALRNFKKDLFEVGAFYSIEELVTLFLKGQNLSNFLVSDYNRVSHIDFNKLELFQLRLAFLLTNYLWEEQEFLDSLSISLFDPFFRHQSLHKCLLTILVVLWFVHTIRANETHAELTILLIRKQSAHPLTERQSTVLTRLFHGHLVELQFLFHIFQMLLSNLLSEKLEFECLRQVVYKYQV